MTGMGANNQLEGLISRIERLESEKADLQSDIGEVYKEAKELGFDTKIIRKVVKLRKMSPEERANEAALIDTYMEALGMLSGTPLGEAAVKAEFGKAAE
jgi:uncharacterized protein (UPF0335 family)